MSILKKTNDFSDRFTRIAPVAKVLSLVFKALTYVSAVLAALLLVVAFVLVFVDVGVDDLLFTPHMDKISDGRYALSLGNGIEIVPNKTIGADHIKGAAYSGIFTLFAILLVCVPIFGFLGKLMKNVGKKEPLSVENAMLVNYIGLCITVGTPLVLLVKQFFNYKLVSIFVDEKVVFNPSIDVYGILLGIFIMIVGTIYGYACSMHKKETALILSNRDD